MKKVLWLAFFATLSIAGAQAAINQTKGDFEDKFRQLDETFPTPNVYRNAAGEPGHEYWQQQVDYKIKTHLDEENRRLKGSETITYSNNSPDTLKYLWLQLDQNRFSNDSMESLTDVFGGIGGRGPSTEASKEGKPAKITLGYLRQTHFKDDVKLGFDISNVKDAKGNALHYVIVGTNMRIDLAEKLKPGQRTEFSLDFEFNILEENSVSARAGYEHFPDDEREGGNDIFLLAQWYPRLHAYTDYEAWTNKEFLGRGEFTLEFGDFEVEMTVPKDHIVASTGELQNPKDVLTRKRLSKFLHS